MQHAIEGLDSYGDDRSCKNNCWCYTQVLIQICSVASTHYQKRTKVKHISTEFFAVCTQSRLGSHSYVIPKSLISTTIHKMCCTALQPTTQYNNMGRGSPEITYEVEQGVRKSRIVANDYLDPRSHQTASLSSMDLTSPLSGGAEAFHQKKKSFLLNDCTSSFLQIFLILLNKIPKIAHNDIVETQKRERSNSKSVKSSPFRTYFIETMRSIGTSSIHSINDSRQRSTLSGLSTDLLNGAAVEQRQIPDDYLDSPHSLRVQERLSNPGSYSPTSTHQFNNSHRIPQRPVELTPSQSLSTRHELTPTSDHTSPKIHGDLHQSSRSSTPLPSISKKRPASPSTSTITRKIKSSSSFIFNEKRSVSPINGKETSTKFTSNFPGEETIHGYSSISRNGEHISNRNAQMDFTRRNEDDQASETDGILDISFAVELF